MPDHANKLREYADMLLTEGELDSPEQDNALAALLKSLVPVAEKVEEAVSVHDGSGAVEAYVELPNAEAFLKALENLKRRMRND